MNIFQKVTLQSLRKNKTRTAVTIIGIMLSTALICAVTTSVASFINYALMNTIHECGRWHGSTFISSEKEAEELKKYDKIETIAYGQQLGYARIENKNNYKPYIYVLGASDNFKSLLPVNITTGSYPETSAEILIPEHLAENGGVYYKIGDEITLDIGERMSDGYPLNQYNPCYTIKNHTKPQLNDEVISEPVSNTYTVVGFYERPVFEPFSAPGYTAITIADSNTETLSCYAYFTFHKPKDAYQFMNDNYPSGETNDNLLEVQGSFKTDNLYRMIYGLAAIFIGLIMFGSVSLIYNAFAISVSERTKQFGLLSSVGATKKQLRRMVFFEAFGVSLIGIPSGILIGVIGIGITLLLIGSYFNLIFDCQIPMRVCVSPEAIGIACVVALFTVLISAWIPSRRATRVSAIEAIRQSSDVKAENKPVRTPKIVYKLFGLPGLLAQKHFKRSKKKYRATVVSLFMSIVLFISASAFSDYLMESVSVGYNTIGFDLRVSSSIADLEENMSLDEVLKLVENNKYVDRAAYLQSNSFSGYISEKQLSYKGREYLSKEDTHDAPSDKMEIQTSVNFVNDIQFRQLLEQYQLNESEYMNTDSPLAIALDGNTVYNAEQEKYINLNLLKGDHGEISASTFRNIEGYNFRGGQTDENGNTVYKYVSCDNPEEYFEIPDEEARIYLTFNIGKTIYERPFYIMDIFSSIILIYPYSMMEYVMSDSEEVYSEQVNYLIQSEDHASCYTSLENEFKKNQLTPDIFDYAAGAEQERNIVLIIQVFSYGFIVLISLIAMANVFNTISTNISLRRREFAMLRSIGMTDKGFNKMMNYECILYGTKALGWGLPFSIGITYLIYKAVGSGYTTDFYLPWGAIVISVLSVFAVVFATMHYAMNKLKKDNPIDDLRNENY